MVGKPEQAYQRRGAYHYSALCMHSDFQKLVMEQWTGNVYPAVRILLGESQNGSSILKSLGDYGKSVASSYALNQKDGTVLVWNQASASCRAS